MIRVVMRPSGRTLTMDSRGLAEWVITQANITQIVCGDRGVEIWTGSGAVLSQEQKIAWAREELGVSFGGCCG